MDNKATFWMVQLFKKSLWERSRFHQIEKLFGSTTGDMRCLIVGGSAAMHYAVHQFRGQWTSLAHSPEDAKALRSLLGGQIIEAPPHQLPFDDGEMDRVILVDVLNDVSDEHAFMQDCHRILKDSGILILNVAHRKRWGMATGLNRMLDMQRPGTGAYPNGFTNSELFDLLKDGFDVQETHSHSRFFLETTHSLSMYLGGLFIREERPPDDQPALLADYYHRIYKFFALIRPAEWLLTRLDLLMFLANGYQLTARAKKRMWRPRKTPILRDGRSIAEATLGGKIGSALEW